MPDRADSIDLRLVLPAGAAWLTAWLGTGVPVWWRWSDLVPVPVLLGCAALAAAGLTAATGLRVRAGRGGGALALSLAAVCLLLTGSAGLAEQRARGPVPGWIDQRAVATVSGRVSEDPRQLPAGPFGGPPRLALTLTGVQVSARDRQGQAGGQLTVLASSGGRDTAGWHRATVGSRVTVTGRLLPAEGVSRQVALLVTGRPPRVAPAAWPWRVADSVRSGLRSAATGAGPDADGLLPALVVGDVSRLPADLKAAMQATGLSHLTAVSGANLTIVAGGAVWLSAALGARRGTRVLVAAVAIVAFVVLARPQPSVLRAAVMAAVALAGLVRGRPGRGLPALAGCVLLLLGLDPWLARSFGFALSVTATAGLVLLAPVLARRWSRVLPAGLAMALAVPVAAELCTAPVAVALRPTISLVSVPANLLAGLAVAPATVLGVLAALASTISDQGARALAWPALQSAGWIARVARTAAAVPDAAIPLPAGPPAALLGVGLAALPVLALVLLTRDRPLLTRGRRPVAAPVAALGILALAGWLGMGFGVRTAGWPPPRWLMVACDVGQGDALVINSGPGRAVLIDTGPEPDLVDGCLRRLGVRRLDLVVVTHHHSDHAGGLAGAIRGRPVGRLLVSPLARPAQMADRVGRLAAAAGAGAVPGWAGSAGSVGRVEDRVDWQVLWPVRSGVPGQPLPVGEDGDTSLEDSAANDASVVLLVQVAGVRLLALGDVEPAAQREIGRRAVLPDRVDVVKVSHHGSSRQDPGLYARIRPRVALIGVGANSYGHPAPGTLAMLGRLGSVVLRTDRMGDVALVGGPEDLAAQPGGG